MAWKITKDWLGGEPQAEGVTSHKWKNSMVVDAVRFRLYDDDRILYYEGVMSRWGAENAPLAPLYDYGLPNAGCTELRLWEDGKWVTV